jgi:uncharacterized protein YjiS (DUF1127 family)
MAFYEYRSPLAALPRLQAAVMAVWVTPFDRRQKRIARRIEEMRALSDDQLAKLGLRREDILSHVFSTQ